MELPLKKFQTTGPRASYPLYCDPKMAFPKLLLVLVFISCTSNAAFNVFSGFDSTVQIAYGISTTCLAALYVSLNLFLRLMSN
jgi:hypothetical protein